MSYRRRLPSKGAPRDPSKEEIAAAKEILRDPKVRYAQNVKRNAWAAAWRKRNKRSARAIVSKPQFDQLVKRIERLEKKLGKK